MADSAIKNKNEVPSLKHLSKTLRLLDTNSLIRWSIFTDRRMSWWIEQTNGHVAQWTLARGWAQPCH